MIMQASTEIKDFIRSYEKLCLEAYQDVGGIWTIGYGHTGDVSKGDLITVEQAEELFEKDVKSQALNLNGILSSNGVEVTQQQFDAMLSLSFNIGCHALKLSTLFKRLCAGDIQGVANEFPRWNKATIGGKKVPIKGLTNRRNAEREIFLNGNYVLHR